MTGVVRKSLISIGIVSTWLLLIFFFLYKDNNELGKWFGVSVMLVLTRNGALVVGAIALMFRLLKLIQDNTNLFYILFGILNLSVGIACIILFLFKQVDMQWLNKGLLNLLAGFLIIVDTLFLKRKY